MRLLEIRMSIKENDQLSLMQTSKKLLTLALPMAVVQLVTTASGFLCMVMLAQLGREELAASGLFFAAQIALSVAAMSVLFSLSVVIGHAYGAKDYRGIGNYIQQGWSL